MRRNTLARVVNALSQRHAWTIVSPINGANVSATVSVSGGVGHLAPNERAWLTVELVSGHIYPQCRVESTGLTYDQSVRIGILESGKSTGQKFMIKLVSASAESNYQFDKYIRGESRQKDWLYLRWPSDTRC
jgi:hypothetical protein